MLLPIFFFKSFLTVCSVSLLYSSLAHYFGFVFRLGVFVSFNPNCLISFLSSSICLVVLLLFVNVAYHTDLFTCVELSL